MGDGNMESMEESFHLELTRKPHHNGIDVSRSKEIFLKRKFCKVQHRFWLIIQSVLFILHVLYLYT